MLRKNHINIVRKTLVLATGLFLTVSVCGYIIAGAGGDFFSAPNNNFSDNRLITNTEVMSRLKEKASMAKDYVDVNGFDVSYCFMI